MPTGEHRAWRTDLASGLTQASAGSPYGYVGAAPLRVGLDTWFPGEGSAARARFRYSPLKHEQTFRFYAWASLIENGRIVATDYAPDVGWLEEGVQPALGLVGPNWTFESEFPSLSVIQSLRFAANGQLSIDAGCNRGTASMIAESGALTVRDMVLTAVPCSNEVAEADAALMAVMSTEKIAYSIEGGVLELRAGDDAIQLEASYQGPPG